MGGYNSSIFAYGQTGAGKTFTMQGPLKAAAAQDGNDEVRAVVCVFSGCSVASAA
jgi:kinesin family protein 15